MRKLLLFMCLCTWSFTLFAQTQITGKVTSAEDGESLPGVNVIIEGTGNGTVTDVDGNYSLSVPASAKTLIFSFVGLQTQKIDIGSQTVIDVQMNSDITELSEVVVTALGISREKRSLGYSTQEVSGEKVNTVQTDNFVNSLSGKVAGVNIKRTTNMGGSTNIVIRGNTSLTGNNQALFVIDGVPISNNVTNSRSQEQAGSGYDYGNAAADINPDNIESINVLKGAAASALYGSRAANGVIMITTKKGSKKANGGLDIAINSGVTFSKVDKTTFPKYQTQYGAGYGHYYSGPESYWDVEDLDGDGTDDLLVPFYEDASYGAPFDPNRMVYQWDALYPESPNYLTKTPWKAADNGPIEFFETGVTYNNTLSIGKSNENGSYRFSYTNFDQTGILPNSSLERNNFSLNVTSKVTDKLTASAFGNFIKTDALGRNSTGYGDNITGMWRQWWQTNVDIKALEQAYETTGRNVTWNWAASDDLVPIFWDNPYWTRYENYQNDTRKRFIGNMALSYDLTDWLNIYGRVAGDTYSALQEERRAIGSVPSDFGIGSGQDGSINRIDVGSGYQRRDIVFSEYNYDLMLNIQKDLSEKFNIKSVLGFNSRRTNYQSIFSATNGGLNIEKLYSLQNSVDPLPLPKEVDSKIGVDGLYGSVSLGYNGMLFLDATLRRDHSSTLPEDHNTFYYPSVATSFVFSEMLNQPWLSFGKVRVNYAEVGNSAGFDQINDTYVVLTALNGPNASVADTKKNPDLKPETTKSLEAGLEMSFFNRRLGFDLGVYKTNTVDQILPVRVSESTGYLYKVINSGEVENKGIELSLFGTPIKAGDFQWNVNLNWTKNRNKVLSLTEGLTNLQLGSFQGGVTINATVGQPYGVIYGTDYTYHENGGKLVNETSGEYIKTDKSDHVIGNANPEWQAGLNNSFSYKNIRLSFLIDVQKGGSIFSLDQYYGLATGLYEETAFINDLGNPVRNTLEDGGGFINDGVNDDGSTNETRIRADRYGAFGYRRGLPDKAFVYDASYVKLREVALSYSLPDGLLTKLPFNGITISAVGSNLWIIHKNLPHADPESGLGAGNLQGYTAGSLPSTRNYGFNLKLQF